MDYENTEILQAILDNQREMLDEQNRKIDRLNSHAQAQRRSAQACQEAVEKLMKDYTGIEEKADEALSEALESRLSAVEKRIGQIAEEPLETAQKGLEKAQKTMKLTTIVCVAVLFIALAAAFGCWYWTQSCIAELQTAQSAFQAAVDMANAVEVELTPPQVTEVNPIESIFTAIQTALFAVASVTVVIVIVTLIKNRRW